LPEDKLDKSGVRDAEVMAKVSTFGYAPLLRNAAAVAVANAGI
jgi:phosphate transport system permease protein